MEKVISRLMPLPMPRSVICSPSHITNIAPVVSITHHHEAGREARDWPRPRECDSVNSAKV